MKARFAESVLLVALGVFLAQIAGCPTTTDGDGTVDPNDSIDPNDGIVIPDDFDPNEIRDGIVVIDSAIPLLFDGSLEVGTDLIVFGTETTAGVAYVMPSTNPTESIDVPGSALYSSTGFAVTGTKIIMPQTDHGLAVYDTSTAITTSFGAEVVYLDRIPDEESEDMFSPVRADGDYAIIRSDPEETLDGVALRLLDLSGDPTLTALVNPDEGVYQVAIDATDMIAIAAGADSFWVYDLINPSAAPRHIDLSTGDGIKTGSQFAYDDGYILYFAATVVDNTRLLRVADEVVLTLDEGPGRSTLDIALSGGKFAYFVQRSGEVDEVSNTDLGSSDTFSAIYRCATGLVPLTEAELGGPATGDPRDSDLPWEGFGVDIAIPPRGDWIFLAGNNAVNVETEFLQVSLGGAFVGIPDGGYVNATDVVANANIVAYKTGVGQSTTLGYAVLP